MHWNGLADDPKKKSWERKKIIKSWELNVVSVRAFSADSKRSQLVGWRITRANSSPRNQHIVQSEHLLEDRKWYNMQLANTTEVQLNVLIISWIFSL